MNSQIYKSIIYEFLVPYWANNCRIISRLHQDNDPKHSSKICLEALEMFGINWVLKIVKYK